MPTVFAHAAVPLALGGGLGSGLVSGRLVAAGVVLAALPDLDVVTLHWGVPYAAGLGHRGFSHSLLMAALVALVGACAHRALRSGFAGAFAFLFASMASHGALDAFTDGGLGVAFLWP
jgi:inner membrane protein